MSTTMSNNCLMLMRKFTYSNGCCLLNNIFFKTFKIVLNFRSLEMFYNHSYRQQHIGTDSTPYRIGHKAPRSRNKSRFKTWCRKSLSSQLLADWGNLAIVI